MTDPKVRSDRKCAACRKPRRLTVPKTSGNAGRRQQLEAELALPGLGAGNHEPVLLEVVPGRILGLLMQRRDIGAAGILAPAMADPADQIVDRGHRLARPAMAPKIGNARSRN